MPPALMLRPARHLPAGPLHGDNPLAMQSARLLKGEGRGVSVCTTPMLAGGFSQSAVVKVSLLHTDGSTMYSIDPIRQAGIS